MDLYTLDNQNMTQTTPEYLKNLNGPQSQGVLTTEGPVLVIAGAGSGKTKMLTSRIAHLIRGQNVDPTNILAVTFTNKAAGEMRERVAHLLGYEPESWKAVPFWAENFMGRQIMAQPTIGTFHSVCIRILRREIQRLPFTAQFQVLDDSDQQSLVKECFAKLNLSDKMFSPKNFQYSINEAKCGALEPKDVLVSEFDIYAKNFSKIYAMYQQEMFKSNSIDFGEIITLTYKLFRDNPEVLAKYQDLYRYIHVDEYQDTNRAQYLIITQLASMHKNLCVVGDEDQSIYRWRGADIKNILDFENDYPSAVVIKLEQNYRSTQTIINASSELIAHNTTRKKKTLWTANEEGTKIQRVQLTDDHKEADFVVRSIKHHCEEDFAFRDVSIFYRTNAQSRIFEDVLRREKVPYNIIGALKFYDRKEIKDAMAYMRSLMNPADSISLKRIINVPTRGIGKTTIEKVEEIQFARGITFGEAIPQAIQAGAVTGAAARKLADFSKLMNGLRELMPSVGLAEFFHEVLDRTGYISELKLENTEESFARVENLQEFDTIISEFQADNYRLMGEEGSHFKAQELLPAFLESVTLAAEAVTAEGGSSGVVSLMTLHTSKGLEFPLVFIVGCEEGLFPSIRGTEEPDPEEIEEERRLCYVGMTRAKQLLYMSHAVSRRIYGNIVFQEPSRFFDEIPAHFLDFKDMSLSGGLGQTMSGRHYVSDEQDVPAYDRTRSNITSGVIGASLSPGMVGKRVRHASYGAGQIKATEGLGADMKVTVEFKSVGVKKFIMKFAQLQFES